MAARPRPESGNSALFQAWVDSARTLGPSPPGPRPTCPRESPEVGVPRLGRCLSSPRGADGIGGLRLGDALSFLAQSQLDSVINPSYQRGGLRSEVTSGPGKSWLSLEPGLRGWWGKTRICHLLPWAMEGWRELASLGRAGELPGPTLFFSF